tara:strand:+ start:430 stop:603 length:174 start_codon:yes stop_codon:yes gene_type:complete
MEIEVQVKTVYGNNLIYPICNKAKSFTTLTKTKTLSREDIAVIKALGYSVKTAAQAI